MRYILPLFPLVLTAAMMHFYRRDTPRMQRFYRRMATSKTARELFLQLTLLAMLLFNLVYVLSFEPDFGVTLATMVCIAMVTFRRAERVMFSLHSTRNFAIASTIVAACVIVQQLWPVAMNIFIVVIASMFYPSKTVIQSILDPKKFSNMANRTSSIIKGYYTE